MSVDLLFCKQIQVKIEEAWSNKVNWSAEPDTQLSFIDAGGRLPKFCKPYRYFIIHIFNLFLVF